MESSSDEAYQDSILPHVSRTFALTIPQLPRSLSNPVTSAYLLCRIADTIEDEPMLAPPETLDYLQRFSAVVRGELPPGPLGAELQQRLSARTLPSERDLVAHMDRVIRVVERFAEPQRAAIRRCVELMCFGMPRFQFNASVRGLERCADLDDYCYYVAGVVGEMLTELFCCHSPQIAKRRTELSALAASFAQGLQMTNILKDVWEDRSRGACWLPQELFARHGVDLAQLSNTTTDERYTNAMRELLGLAHAHLRNALQYTLLVPAEERGIRRFCLWAIGLAILTLRKIALNPRFTAGVQVKVSRSMVKATLLLTNVAVGHDRLLRRLFALAARGLPLATMTEPCRVRPLTAKSAQPNADIEHEHTLRGSFGGSGR